MIFRDDDIGYLTKQEQFKQAHELFERYGVVHTIALMAKDIEKSPLVAYINAHNIDVQLHCWEHIDLTLNHDVVKKQLEMGIAAIEKHFHKRPTVLYPPWNKTDETIDAIAKELGLTVSWEKISLSQYLKVNGDVKEKVINLHSWDYGDLMLLEPALKLYRERNKYSIAVITADIGGFDKPQVHEPQDVQADYYCITENNLPVPLPNLNNRLKSKYIKTQAHRFLPGYDIYIWIDGRVEITSRKFVSNYVKLLQDSDLVNTSHPDRKNIYDELEYMMMELRQGEPYLTARYKDEPLQEELDFYKTTNYPKEFPLFSSGIWARWNNRRLNNFCDDWWRGCIEYCNFDQSMFSYNIWKHGIRYKTIDFENEFFKVGKHK